MVLIQFLYFIVYVRCSFQYVLPSTKNSTLSMPRHVSYTEPLIGRRGIDPVAEAFLVGQNANKTSKDSIVREETLQGRSQIMLQSCGTHKGVRLERVFAEVGRWSRLATRASSLNRYSEYDYVLVESYFTARRHRGTLTAVELVSVFNVYQRLIDEVGHTPQRVVRSRVPREVEITCDESDRLCRSRSSSNVLALHHDDRRNTHINVVSLFFAQRLDSKFPAVI